MSFQSQSFQAKSAATYDFYGPIHKALRLALGELLVRLGRAEGEDHALLADLRRQMHLSSRHLAHEEREIHAALEARCPGASERLASAHEDHQTAFAQIEALIAQVEQPFLPAHASAGLWRRLYLRVSQFVAADLAHMAEEELVTLPVLQSLFTDVELAEIEGRVMQSIAPEDMAAYLSLMIRAGSRSDRLFLLTALHQAAPAEAFDGLVTTAIRPQLTAEEWTDLERAFLAAVPTASARPSAPAAKIAKKKRLRLPIMI